ncbi:hypothetical protein IT418_03500 [bacterium]|nr:hypothetical protein [bacterium]
MFFFIRTNKNIFIALFFVVLICLLSLFSILSVHSYWDNSSSWSSKTIQVPDNNVNIRSKLQLLQGQEKNLFSYTTEYCRLRLVTYTTETITLTCDMITGNSTEDQTNTENDVKLIIERSAISNESLLLSEDFENKPKGETIPISLTIKGRSERPKRNVISMLSHYTTLFTGKESFLTTKATSVEVKRLDQTTIDQKALYTQLWRIRMNKFMKESIFNQVVETKKPQEKLYKLRAFFEPTNQKCSKLTACTWEYSENPSEKAISYVYGLYYSNKSDYSILQKLLTEELYPFNPVYPKEPKRVWVGSVTPWKIFSVYNYSVCPIAEVITGKQNENSEMFLKYAKVLEKYELLTRPVDDFLAANPKTKWTELGGWDTDYIGEVDYLCSQALYNKLSTEQKKKFVTLYFTIYSIQSGWNISYDKSTIERLVYEMDAFSPYSSPLLLDLAITTARQKNIEPLQQQQQEHIEWGSLLNTLILLYLYETF